MTFIELAQPWWDRGWIVLPGREKRPVIRGSYGWPDSERPTDETIKLAFSQSDGSALLYPASNPDFQIVVVDIDNEDYADRAIDDFGYTPLAVGSARMGHLYYRAPGKVVSRTRIYGPGSVDIKTFGAYVVAPGAPGKTPMVDAAETSVAEFVANLDRLPMFDVEAYERIWAESAPRRRAANKSAAKRSKAYIYVAERPIQTKSGLDRIGDIFGDHPFKAEDDRTVRIDQAAGCRGYRLGDEDDSNPNCEVWKADDGSLWYQDWPAGITARVVTGIELELARKFEREPDPVEPVEDVITLPAEGWIDLEPSDGLTILKAPHGTGKTFWAKSRIQAARTAISICNTAALAEHNAERFDVPSYKLDPKGPKVSTTLNSLPKCTGEFDVCHIDEFDGVCAYAFSGNVGEARATFNNMLDRLARAREALITSADLDDDQIQAAIDWYRKRAPDKPVRVVVKPPIQGRRKVTIGTLAQAKAQFLDAKGPKALGWTRCRDVEAIAMGLGDGVRWISSENSRIDETVEGLRGNLLDGVDVLAFSPALLSGVSVEAPCQTVVLLFDMREFPAESIVQMLMRFRSCENFYVGICGWDEVWIRDDDVYLDAVCQEVADRTDAILTRLLPGFVSHRPEDPDFARAWRVAQRRIRRSYRNPVDRLIDVFEGHGWAVNDERDDDFEDPRFGEILTKGRDLRDAAETARVVGSEDIHERTAERIGRSYVQRKHEADKLKKHRIGEFYGLPVTEDLVQIDRGGKYRARVKAFASTQVPDAVLARLEDVQDKHAVEYRHRAQRALLLRTLVTDVLGSFEDGSTTTQQLTQRAGQWQQTYGAVWTDVAGPFSTGGKDPVKFVGTVVRRLGGSWSRVRIGDDMGYAWSFSEVKRLSRAYLEKLITG